MQIDLVQILMQIANFAILLFVLNKFLYQPVLKILESRSKKIQEGLEAAEKSLEEKAKTEEKKAQLLQKAEKEAADLLDEARVEAKQAGKDIITTARKEARDSIEKEYKILAAKLQEEEHKVRKNIAQLVTETTHSVLQGTLDEKAQRQIIKSQIQKLGRLKN